MKPLSACCIFFVLILLVALLDVSAQAQSGRTSIDSATQSYEVFISPPRRISDSDLKMLRKESKSQCRQLSEQEIAQNEIAAIYFPIWKNRIMTGNGFDDATFDRHIVVTRVQDRNMTHGHSLIMNLCIKIDWLTITSHSDHLWVLISPAFVDARNLGIRRNVYLTEDEINAIHDVYHNIMTIDIQTPFLFKSKKEAVQKLREASGARYLDSQVHGTLLLRDGVNEPWLQGFGKVNEEANICQNGLINLYTGEIKLQDIPCRP